MSHEDPIILAVFLGLIINTIVGLNINMQIKDLIKILYPEIWRTIGYNSVLENSIDKSNNFLKLIIRPPSEINYRPLLRLFTIAKVILLIQIGLIISIVLVSGMLARHTWDS